MFILQVIDTSVLCLKCFNIQTLHLQVVDARAGFSFCLIMMEKQVRFQLHTCMHLCVLAPAFSSSDSSLHCITCNALTHATCTHAQAVDGRISRKYKTPEGYFDGAACLKVRLLDNKAAHVWICFCVRLFIHSSN